MKTAKVILFIAALVPTAWLIYGVFTNNLGANPVEYIEHTTGWWALTFMMITLGITPVRRLIKWNKIIRFRRMVGLFAFYYVTVHFLFYLSIDRGLDFSEITKDIAKRPYITLGFSGWLMLIPLAVTSTKGWIRKLGKRWRKLHYLTYVIALAGVIHFWWLVKADIFEPLIFACIYGVLMLSRIKIKSRSKGTNKPLYAESVAE